jgi:hypothetical protein
LSESPTTVEWLRFHRTSLTKRLEVEVKETTRQWLEAKLLVEDHIGEGPPLVELPSETVLSLEDAEETAENLRKRWDISDWLVENISAAMA